jgi:hypothetical protein
MSYSPLTVETPRNIKKCHEFMLKVIQERSHDPVLMKFSEVGRLSKRKLAAFYRRNQLSLPRMQKE